MRQPLLPSSMGLQLATSTRSLVLLDRISRPKVTISLELSRHAPSSHWTLDTGQAATLKWILRALAAKVVALSPSRSPLQVHLLLRSVDNSQALRVRMKTQLVFWPGRMLSNANE